jgi:hypothetical protein
MRSADVPRQVVRGLQGKTHWQIQAQAVLRCLCLKVHKTGQNVVFGRDAAETMAGYENSTIVDAFETPGALVCKKKKKFK